jgi:hypothetical protein
MCAKRFLNHGQPAGATLRLISGSSPARVKTIRSRYRVLSQIRRRIGLSVNRDCAGPKALNGLKGSSPDKQNFPRWPSKYRAAKAIPGFFPGTSGVQGLGMYRRLIMELGRSLGSRKRIAKFSRQRLKSKLKITLLKEVRCLHSSEAPNESLWDNNWKEVG